MPHSEIVTVCWPYSVLCIVGFHYSGINRPFFAFAGDEMFSDIYKIKESEMMFEVEGKVGNISI